MFRTSDDEFSDGDYVVVKDGCSEGYNTRWYLPEGSVYRIEKVGYTGGLLLEGTSMSFAYEPERFRRLTATEKVILFNKRRSK